MLFAAAIRHGFKMKCLFERVWKDLASVDDLLRDGGPWLSLFDGDSAFLDRVRTMLDVLSNLEEGDDCHRATADQYIDVQLSATLVEPLAVGGGTAGGQELEDFARAASSARFHFRHDPGGAVSRSDLDGEGANARLALAARASASFPGAFEAAVVRSTRPTAIRRASGGRVRPARRPVD